MNDLYSIGEIAALTGISVDTIRVWERRYGRPAPVRLPSGHRRYTQGELGWLRLVAEALALGFRPGHVVRADGRELEHLLVRGRQEEAEGPEIRALLALVRGMRPRELRSELLAGWRSLGPKEFLAACLSPFITRVGHLWAAGELEVRHERLVSEVLNDLLRELRSALGPAREGPLVLLATLSGERHALGLGMVELACALRGVPCQALGTDVPGDQIALAALELGARAVLISVSLATAGAETDRRLRELATLLPQGTTLVAGGRGIRDGAGRRCRGVRHLRGFGELEEWLEELRAPAPAERGKPLSVEHA